MVDYVNSINLSLSLSRRLADQSNNEFNITMSFSGKFHVVAIQGLCQDAILSEEEGEDDGSDLDGMTTIIFPTVSLHKYSRDKEFKHLPRRRKNVWMIALSS